jgi:hypothetical protein
VPSDLWMIYGRQSLICKVPSDFWEMYERQFLILLVDCRLVDDAMKAISNLLVWVLESD